MKRPTRRLAITLFGLAALGVGGSPSVGQRPANLEGFWMDSHGEVILEVNRCDDAMCAKVAWLKKPNGPDGLPLTDYRNPDETLRNRPVCGLRVVTGFKPQSDGTWGDGTVYVSDLGSSYSGYAEVLNANEVKITGYIFIPLFGQSEVWSRVTAPFDHCEKSKAKGADPDWSAKTTPVPKSR
ncbi:MAG: DUF2147 domain-containing protein [Hyphomicrobium sp.]